MRIETETNLTNVLMGELLDAARTGKFQRGQVVYSAPYEKVEIAVLSPRRKRAHTVPRALLAQKRHSAPYEVIEILPGQSINMVASGSFEAAWFASPEDEIVEPESPAQVTDGAKWMMIGGGLLGACALVIGLLTFV